MKKIIAILLALAVVSMAFAQTVSVSNKLETNPQIHVDGSTNQWSVSPTLKDTVEGKLTTEDGRATVWGKASFQLQWKDSAPNAAAASSNKNNDIASFTPRYVFTASSEANASFKPFEFLEVGLGTGLGGGATGIVSVGPGFAWEGGCGKAGAKPSVFNGDRQKVTREGMYVAFTGVPGLSVIAGVDNKFADAGFALIKKNVFGAGVGAKYATDLFEVGASWRAVFGLAEDATTTVAENKAYNNQSIYVGGTFKGLEALPVGISINAKAAIVMNNGVEKTTNIGLGVGASFNFNNGIKTSPDFSIAFATGGDSYKVLPFYVGNTLEFKPNDDVTFKLLTGYAQSGLENKMSTYTGKTGAFSAITLKPEFSFSMGRHSFNFAVKTVVSNNHQYVEKTDTDWAFSRMYGKCAKVEFPISWTYNF